MNRFKNNLALTTFTFLLSLVSGCGQVKPETKLTDISYGIDLQANKHPDSVSIKILSFATANPGSVNSHLIVSNKGIIVIDVYRTTSAAKLLAEKIDSLRKPLLAIIITHAHPDHFGGLEFLHSKYTDVPIYASSETIHDLKTDEGGYIKSTKSFVGKDFGSNVPIPTHVLNSTQKIGDIYLIMEQAGPGESATSSVIYLPALNALFAADLINHNMIPYLFEKRSGKILDQLNMFKDKFKSATVYPGHGLSGASIELFEEEINYLTYFRQLIAERLSTNNKISNAEKNEIISLMEERYQGYEGVTPMKPAQIYGYNIDAVADELKSLKKQN